MVLIPTSPFLLPDWIQSVFGDLWFPKLFMDCFVANFLMDLASSCPIPLCLVHADKDLAQNLTKTVFITRHTSSDIQHKKPVRKNWPIWEIHSTQNHCLGISDKNVPIEMRMKSIRIWSGSKMTKMIMGLFDRPAQWTAFRASEPSSRSDMRKVAQQTQWQFWPSTVTVAQWHWCAAKWQFSPSLLFSNQPYHGAHCSASGGDDERWDASIKNVSWKKSRITFTGEQKQDGDSILSLFHWEWGTKQTWHCPFPLQWWD